MSHTAAHRDKRTDSVILADVLTAFGAQVLGPVTSLPRGESLVRQSDGIDAAILDVDLRGEEVFPLAELLEVRRVPLLFYTGRGERPALSERFPAAGICTKPVPTDAVIAALRELLK